MPFHHSGLGFSASVSHSAQRYCYARASSLDQLLAAPGSLELLLQELTGEPPKPSSVVEQLAQLKRQAIHLSVTRSAFHGLSLEEIVVLCAYTSPHFEHSAFRHQLLAEPSPTELSELCKTWLRERATHVTTGEELGARRWPLVGHSPRESNGQPSPPASSSNHSSSAPGHPNHSSSNHSSSAPGHPNHSSSNHASSNHSSSAPGHPNHSSSALLSLGASFAVGVAPMPHSLALDRDLPGLGVESGFAHEHYIACTPATALDYVRRAATLGNSVRWDPFALDRRLRSLGLGLLLVEGRTVTVYLPARYHPSPLRTSSAPPQSGAFSR